MVLDTALPKKTARHLPAKRRFIRSLEAVSLGCAVFALIGVGVVLYSKLYNYDAMVWWYLAEAIGITFVIWFGSIQLRRYGYRKLPSRTLPPSEQLWRLRLQLTMSWIETGAFITAFYLLFLVAGQMPQMWVRVAAYTIIAILFVSLPSVGQRDRSRINRRIAFVKELPT